MYTFLYHFKTFQLIEYTVSLTTFFQLRDHYLEAEKYDHATKMRVITIFQSDTKRCIH